jgi:2-polyprenyl-3-methyl-5-hydroxy-6-metoxy-1,4-benzoquinol methylase
MLKKNNHQAMKSASSVLEQKDPLAIPDNCVFYQTISLPGVGVIDGSWDHREHTDVYLGNTDFQGKRVLDVGPANGFFSFEMEKRGAQVVAIDLGQQADWDAVPHPDINVASLKDAIRKTVQAVENAFWFAHKILNSQVDLVYGSVYETPNLIDKVDVALMSNILQHFRDPFRAIEQVAKVVGERIIITETLWDGDDNFINSRTMRLIPAISARDINQSWWLVSPTLVIEILKLLDFPQIRCEFHKQWFNGTSIDKKSRLVPHFTITGTRTSNLRVAFTTGWHEEERNERSVWHWSAQKNAGISIKVPANEPCRAELSFELASIRTEDVKVYFNRSLIWHGRVTEIPQPVHLKGLDLHPGENSLEINSASQPTPAGNNDSRSIGVAVYNFIVRSTYMGKR